MAPAPGDKAPGAEVCAFKYAKPWAYAVVIADARSGCVPSPLRSWPNTITPTPCWARGLRRPFALVAVIVGVIGNNDATVNWRTWGRCSTRGGVMNHSFDHRANDWSGDSAKLSDAQARRTPSGASPARRQFAGGRAPTGAVYANEIHRLQRRDALADAASGLPHESAAPAARRLSPQVKWMDFPRSYLDENVWVNEWNKARPMADFQATTRRVRWRTAWRSTSHTGSTASPVRLRTRWRARLKTIESRWGAEGADALWCAPTAEVADYVRAARAVKATPFPGRLTVFLPDQVPGSALTLRLSELAPKALLSAEGGALYRQGDAVALTTPRMAPAGRLLQHRGSGASTPGRRSRWISPSRSPSPALPSGYREPGRRAPIPAGSARGKRARGVCQRTVGPGWVVGGLLCPILPAPDPLALGLPSQFRSQSKGWPSGRWIRTAPDLPLLRHAIHCTFLGGLSLSSLIFVNKTRGGLGGLISGVKEL